MCVLRVEQVSKSFRIPTEIRQTIREHTLALLRRRRFQRLDVLDGVSFSLARGETLGIMGRNGSGKSTLLKIVAGIYDPDAGAVFRSAPITPILELGVGWNMELNAIDNICLLGCVMGMTLAELRRRTQSILCFAGLSKFANLELKHYSSGMAARLAYAVAFEAARDVLILDEIFAVGDAEFKDRCYQKYNELHALGRSMLLVSHSPYEVSRFCDRGLLLEGGKIVLAGSGAEVAEAYSELMKGPG